MSAPEDEEELLRSVALKNAKSILLARQQAEDALRRQSEWLRITLASIGDAVISTDAEGRVTFMNGVAETLTGWTQVDAIGKPLIEIFRIVNEKTRQIVENPVEKVFRHGHVVGMANHTTLIAKEGTEWPIDDSAAPIKDDRGEITGVVLVFHEVTEKRAAENALAETEEFNRRVIASSTDCLKVLDLDGRLLSMNDFGCHLMEIDDFALCLNKEWVEFWPAYLRETARDALMKAKSGKVASFHGFCPTAKGNERWWEVVVSPILDAGGTPQRILSVSRDITERRRAEQEARAKDERLSLLVENIKDYAVIISDPEGTVTEWQGGAERITGYSAAEAVGQGAHLIFTPEDRAASKPEAEMRKAAREKRAEDKRWHLKKDGTRFYADGVMTALYDDGGQLRGFGKVFKDATGEKQSEEATRRRTFQLQKLADISAQINMAHDVHSVIGVVTEEARNLIGARQSATSMVLTPLDAQPINVISTAPSQPSKGSAPHVHGGELYETIKEEHRPIRLSQHDLGQDPRWRTLGKVAMALPIRNGWLATPLVGRNGKSIGLLQLADKDEGEFTAEDEALLIQLSRLAAIAIENAKLYDELRGNDQRKDEFLAMLAHELRNPLAAISNAVSVTTRSGHREQIDWSMEVIARQMQHLTRLIDDLLDVSRINRGKIELRRDVLDATTILDSAAATVRPLVDERKHTLDVKVDRGNLWVSADPTRLEQVVVNLLNNAAKYSENAGHIDLTAVNEGRDVVITIRDKGVGIPPEKLPEMFELFAQGDRSLARSEGGLGIGLTVVKKLVEMHGGSIAAKSEGIGNGSEFTIRLPAVAKPDVPRPAASVPLEPARKKVRILVVDDNVDTARGMARLLKIVGHEVVTAHDGYEAFDVARDFNPDFILLDIGLPGMNGYEVASGLRREQCCKDAVIVAVSGYGQDEDRRRSKEAGFDHHLIKPLDHDALLHLLAGVGNGRP